MNRRIFGVETEYGISCASLEGADAPFDAERSAQYLFADMLEQEKSTNMFLPNGARLYLDVGAHPEYASAECDQLADLLANERAGDILFARMAQQANKRLESEGIAGRIHLFKNNLDSQGNSFGCHENYLIHRHKDFRSKITTLIPFFVTRQILVGAGFINRQAQGGAKFQISPRAEQMWDAVSSASTQARPIINTRDEPHGDPDRFRRMHVIVGDSNMCQATLALKIGMVHAVLSVLEVNPEVFGQYSLANPPAAIRAVSADLTGRALVELANGQWMSALDIQRSIYEAVIREYSAQGWLKQLDPLMEYVCDLWNRALTALETGDFSYVVSEIDWIAKRALIEKYCSRSAIGLDDPRAARLELAWHDITDQGLRAKLEAGGMLKVLVSDAAVSRALVKPPQTTRAKLRGAFIEAARSAKRDYMADWSNLRLVSEQGSMNVALADPFAAKDSRVDELIQAVQAE